MQKKKAERLKPIQPATAPKADLAKPKKGAKLARVIIIELKLWVIRGQGCHGSEKVNIEVRVI